MPSPATTGRRWSGRGTRRGRRRSSDAIYKLAPRPPSGGAHADRSLPRHAEPAAVATPMGAPLRALAGAGRGGRPPRRRLRLVVRTPLLRGRLPVTAADVRGGDRRAH